ncbi:type II toxin-antitoxin system HicA family toxin [candidate division WOR-3 bacterium]|nr:type II toxin-antitoxin system HicA family toxin [candidate division WOR-3 bacterium]
MKKYTTLPAITGKELIKLLKKDGWIIHRRVTHGVSLKKDIGSRTLVTVVPDTKIPLPKGTLNAILGRKQTRIGKRGLLRILNKCGL